MVACVLIERVQLGTERMVREFKTSRGCMDQEFAVNQVCEKYLGNEKEVTWAFINLEKAYYIVNWEAL